MPKRVLRRSLVGYLPTTVGTIFAARRGESVQVKGLVVTNENAATQTIELFIERGGVDHMIAHAEDVAQNEQYVHGAEFTLSYGDVLRGVTTTASAAAYAISIERVEEAS